MKTTLLIFMIMLVKQQESFHNYLLNVFLFLSYYTVEFKVLLIQEVLNLFLVF